MKRELLDELPPPQRLALSYAPAAARQDTLALFLLDARLAAVVRRRGEPAIAQIRLAWWREVLVKDPADWPEGEAVLALLRGWRKPAALVSLVDGWEALLAEELDESAIEEFAQGRADALACLAEQVGMAAEPAAICARLWALGDLAANLSNPAERVLTLEMAAGPPRCPGLPRALRPLAVLAGLSRRSLDRGGAPLLDGPGAMLVAMRLGITGR